MSYHVPVIQGRTKSRPGKPVGQFGEKFRKAREAKSISLDDVSNVTKIGARMLQAIEQEHFDQLPGGVFNRGFIRAYAKHLGLDPEEAVTDYVACLRQAQIDAQVWEPARPATTAAPPAAPRPTEPEKRPLPAYTKPALKTVPSVPGAEELPGLQLPRPEHVRPPSQRFLGGRETTFPWKLTVVAAFVLILGAILWMRHSRTTQPQAAATTPTPLPQSTPPQTPISAEAAQWAAHNFGVNPAPTATRTSSQPAHAAPPAKAPDNTTDNKNEVQTYEKSDVTVRTIKPAGPPASAPTTAPPLTLIIRATETSWVSIAADGQPHGQETLIAPAHTVIRASKEIVVRVGNAAGVTFLWNNQEIPAQGAEAEVKTYTFDSSGMRVTSPPQPPAQNP